MPGHAHYTVWYSLLSLILVVLVLVLVDERWVPPHGGPHWLLRVGSGGPRVGPRAGPRVGGPHSRLSPSSESEGHELASLLNGLLLLLLSGGRYLLLLLLSS